MGLFIGAAVGGVLAVMLIAKVEYPRIAAKVDAEKQTLRVALEQISLADERYSRSPSNAITLSARINNRHPARQVRDIELTCECVTASGTVLGMLTKTVYEAVPAAGAHRIDNLPIGVCHPDARRVGCEITGVQ